MRTLIRRGGWRLVAAASGTVLFLEGCDPQTRAAIEDGIITSTSSLLGAFLRAFIELGAEARQAEATAQALIDVAGRVFV